MPNITTIGADVATTMKSLDGNFRMTYAKGFSDLRPQGVVVLPDVKFIEKSAQPGNLFNQPVNLTHENGFTHSAPGVMGTSPDTPTVLKSARRAKTANAQVAGYKTTLVSWVDYETIDRAWRGGKQAFKPTMGLTIANMVESFMQRQEALLIHGQSGLGVVTTVHTTNKTAQISAATWAPGLWMGREGAMMIKTASASATSTMSATAWNDATPCAISAVDMSTRKLTFDVTSTVMGYLATGNHLWFHTMLADAGGAAATAFNHAPGIRKILSNTGTLFGISAASYTLWAAHSYNCNSGPLTFGKILKGIAEGSAKGVDEDLILYLNPKAWTDLLTDEAALRRHMPAGGSRAYQAGSEGIQFYTMTGRITLKPSNYMMEGEAYALSPRLWRRIGATDLTFRLEGFGNEDRIFFHMPSQEGVELRCRSNESVFCRAPGKNIRFYGIVNST